MERLRVGVIYGGRSSEHEVSLSSAAAIFNQLDSERYDAIPLFIDKKGRWSIPDSLPVAMSTKLVIQQMRDIHTPLERKASEAHLVAHPSDETVITIARDTSLRGKSVDRAVVRGLSLDVVFPMVHGQYGEDGTLQGLLELANIPFVGAGVLSSALAMDKAMAKVIFAARRLPIVEHEVVPAHEWQIQPDAIIARVENRLGYPVFVKPANLGSSIGVSKGTDAATLRTALSTAWKYDNKLLVEAAVPNAREIECSVLGNESPKVSVPGEVIPAGEFYDYEAKYVRDESKIIIPAVLSAERTAEVQKLAIEAYRSIDCSGMARVDFFFDES